MTQNLNFPKSFQNVAEPAHKNVWALPAAINFFLGGSAAGYYILWVLCVNPDAARMTGTISGGYLAAALVSAGFAALALEAGRPPRARFLAANWKHSWMSREAAAGMVFIIAAIVDAMTASSVARTLALGAACAFLLSQGMMVFRCMAVPVWRDPVNPMMFISSGLAAGYALILFNRYGLVLPQMIIAPYADAIALVCLAANFATWAALVRRGRQPAMQVMARRLLQPAKLALVIGVGQVLPIVLLLYLKPWSSGTTGAVYFGMAVICAPAVLAGNCAQKLWLMRYAQHVCGMQLDDLQHK